LKICDVTQFYSPVSGGVKRYVSEKLKYLRASSEAHEHILIVPGEHDARVEGDRSRVYTIKSPLISRTSGYRALVRLGALERLLELERPDVIECGDPYQVAWKTVEVGNTLGIPVIGFYHSHFSEAYLRPLENYLGPWAATLLLDGARRYVRKLYNRFARTLVPSPALAALLEQWGVRNVTPMDLGVDAEIFHHIAPPARFAEAETLRSELGMARTGRILLYVGRLAPEKNTETLFRASRALISENATGYHLLVVGDGHERAPLQDLARSLGGTALEDAPLGGGRIPDLRLLAPGLAWVPYLSDSQELARLYRAADLFVHPGVQETFGLVTLEAQACGTPVVGIRGSYMDRIIHHHQDAWATENSPAALADAIRSASGLAASEDRAALSREILSRYSWSAVFARLFDLYRQVVESHRAHE